MRYTEAVTGAVVTVVRADNPGPMTGPGTNTYVVESAGAAVVIDPGPSEPAAVAATHAAAIEVVLDAATPVAVVVTHAHPDHAPAANPLAGRLAVPAVGFASGPDFVPDRIVGDGDTVDCGEIALQVIHTPGHTPDHVCYRLGDTLFTGDHVMGGSTVIIEDLAAYLGSLERLLGIGLDRLAPGHGPQLDTPDAVIAEYIDHRLMRERQILAALAAGPRPIDDIVTVVYPDLEPQLRPAAALQVRTHLQKLENEGVVRFAAGVAEASEEPHV